VFSTLISSRRGWSTAFQGCFRISIIVDDLLLTVLASDRKLNFVVSRGTGKRLLTSPDEGNEYMFEGFKKETLAVNGVNIVLRHGGSGPPLLLMHGNPFTHLSWNKVAPRLAKEFTVVCPDLRGYGDS